VSRRSAGCVPSARRRLQVRRGQRVCSGGGQRQSARRCLAGVPTGAPGVMAPGVMGRSEWRWPERRDPTEIRRGVRPRMGLRRPARSSPRTPGTRSSFVRGRRTARDELGWFRVKHDRCHSLPVAMGRSPQWRPRNGERARGMARRSTGWASGVVAGRPEKGIAGGRRVWLPPDPQRRTDRATVGGVEVRRPPSSGRAATRPADLVLFRLGSSGQVRVGPVLRLGSDARATWQGRSLWGVRACGGKGILEGGG
jgi:hypothetical protein